MNCFYCDEIIVNKISVKKIMKQQEIDSTDIFHYPLVKVILIQTLSYFRYTQMLPTVLLQASLIIITIIGGLAFIGIENINIPFANNIEIYLNDNSIIKIYLLLSLLLDIVVSLIRYLTKKKIIWTFWQKIKTILIADALMFFFVFTIVFLLSKSIIEINALTIYLYFMFFIIVIVFSIYGLFINHVINKLINKINE